MISFLLLSSISLALLAAANSNKSVGSIPKPKRNKYAEIAFLQDIGVRFNKESLLHEEVSLVRRGISKFNWKPKKGSNYLSQEDAYFQELRKLYKRITKPIGELVDNGKADVSTIYNQNGDPALVHYQYDLGRDYIRALSWYEDNFVSVDEYARDPFACGVYYIADGGKFLWEGETNAAGKKISHGIADDFVRSKEDKKVYRSIIATKNKGGRSIDDVAESYAGYNGDSLMFRDGIIDAISSFTSRDAAAAYILDSYYQMLAEVPQFDSKSEAPF